MAAFGFQHVRLPMVFDLQADQAPYTIAPGIWTGVDDVVETTRDLGLMLVLDNHPGRLEDAPFDVELRRRVAILEQLAERYASTDRTVCSWGSTTSHVTSPTSTSTRSSAQPSIRCGRPRRPTRWSAAASTTTSSKASNYSTRRWTTT